MLNSTALYEYKPRTHEGMISWFRAKQEENFPVIGLEDERRSLLGFGSYGTFRAWSVYKYSVEYSVYICKDQRGKGLGRLIMSNIIQNARAQGYHVLIGGIDESNMASICMHTKLRSGPNCLNSHLSILSGISADFHAASLTVGNITA
ncbi:N-acetyltransferase family protein [Nitrosospira multiformis]|uniref:GNAT family N-acetyltransferase n=1 Tax=Nitrosospira TaxID=35798 RepID=UPI0035251BC2